MRKPRLAKVAVTLIAFGTVTGLISCLKPIRQGGAPQVIDWGASNIGATSVTLRATVNPNGFATTVYFEWGLTPSYGNRTPGQSIGADTTNVSVSAEVINLTPNTLYHWRVVAMNCVGAAHSPDITFRTSAPINEVAAQIVSYNAYPRQLQIGQSVTLTLTLKNTGNALWTFYGVVSLKKPGGTQVRLDPKPVELNVGQEGIVSWTYTPDVAGNWDVIFEVWKESNQQNNLVDTGWIIAFITVSDVNQPPIIDSLVATPPTVEPGGQSRITVSAYDPDGDLLSYSWSATGGTLSSTTGPGEKIWTAPNAPGIYHITVSVTDNQPGHTPVSRSVSVEVQNPYGPPRADFEAQPLSGVAPLMVQFTNRSQGVITTCFWDFGDGTSSREREPSHTYVTPGRYTVSLTVTGPGGSDTLVRPDYIMVGSSGETWSCVVNVFVLIFNPILETDGGVSLVQYYCWNDPQKLIDQYIADIEECSYGQVRYRVARLVELDEWPLFENGFRYTDESYKIAWENRKMHEGTLDYIYYLDQFGIKGAVDRGEIDEVWIFGFPWGWIWESCMAGPGAIWINGPTIDYPTTRPFPIMGFNYERDVDCMLENLGHRAECVLNHVYNGGWWWDKDATHLWGLFTRIDKTHPGEAGCGTVHFAPNSETDYDWGNPRYVWSTCDDWLYNFPQLTGYKKLVNCTEWGNGDMRLHHKWWFSHFPHHSSRIDGKLINWWKYVIQWDKYGEIGL